MFKGVLLNVWEWLIKLWEWIYIDFVGLFLGYMFFIMVDLNLKWLEVVKMSIIILICIIDVLRIIFFRNGFLVIIVSDNGL